jgi:prepilin-type processing-associated H-X9-DG protein/prepilin-type N-terminal cleavage/methylation domain-containing protein
VRSSGFTLIELLSALGILAVLAVIGTAALKSSRAQAQSAQCVSQLRQWAVAMQLYVKENDGYLPRRGQGVQPVFRIDRPDDWFNALCPYLEMPTYQELYESGQAPKPGARTVFVCPAAKDTGSYTHFICYGMNMYVSRWDQSERLKLVRLPDPAVVAFMADSPGGYASTVPSASAYSVQARHGGRANVSFFDGHVQSFSGSYLGCGTGEKTQSDVRWNPGFPGDLWTPGL